MPMSARRPVLFVALGIVYVVWGSTYLGIRIVVEEIPPMSGMGLRFVIAGLLLGALIALRRGLGALRVTRAQLLGSALLGLLLPALGNGVVAIAESRGATSGYAALLVATGPLVVVVFRALDGDRPSLRTVAGVLLGFVGLAVLVTAGRQGPEAIPLGPALLIVAAATFWSFGSYIQPRLELPKDPLVITTYEMLTGGVMMVAGGLTFGERLSFHYSARSWVALAYLVVFGSLVAYSAFVWLLGHAPISLVMTYAYVNPLIAVLLGAAVLAEPLTAGILVGGLIVVASVGLVITSERSPSPALEGEPETATA
jgi:drug/metabolite transporter (DMT)-like permease